MSGMRPKFLEKEVLSEGYFKQPNPYEVAPSGDVNLLELSRYAKKVDKLLSELTKEEVMQFAKKRDTESLDNKIHQAKMVSEKKEPWGYRIND